MNNEIKVKINNFNLKKKADARASVSDLENDFKSFYDFRGKKDVVVSSIQDFIDISSCFILFENQIEIFKAEKLIITLEEKNLGKIQEIEDISQSFIDVYTIIADINNVINTVKGQLEYAKQKNFLLLRFSKNSFRISFKDEGKNNNYSTVGCEIPTLIGDKNILNIFKYLEYAKNKKQKNGKNYIFLKKKQS